MRVVPIERSFEVWRDASRRLLTEEVPPEDVVWDVAGESQGSLFGELVPGPTRPAPTTATRPTVPKKFVSLARQVSFHRERDRWALMYRMLWRITHGEPQLLGDAVDADTARLRRLSKEVSRDAHKMRAFVRFRRVEGLDGEQFIAWHRPDHLIVPLVAPFFQDRFSSMHWSILTPDQSVHWDGAKLTFSAGVGRSEAPDGDELERLWKSYYRSIFNPARVKLDAMQAEMPQKHWATMPETEIIRELLREAPERVRQMVAARIDTAAPFVPDTSDLDELRRAVRDCEACGLCALTSGPVFGEGPPDARVVLVGEQPGDCEDREGHPFVGPAGEILDRALELAGIDRQQTYVTNSVKAFKHEQRGKNRLHKRPTAYELQVCKPWLAAELRAIKPELVVALGGTAALAITGRQVAVTRERGLARTPFAEHGVVTLHPAAILRASAERQQELFDQLVEDLRCGQLLLSSTVAELPRGRF